MTCPTSSPGWSLIIPGGIATPAYAAPQRRAHVADHPWRDRNTAMTCPTSSPGWSLIIPGGIATTEELVLSTGPPESLITPGGIATRPTDPVVPACGHQSLIIPGGIATPARRRRVRPPGVADHPWRDRNTVTRGGASSTGRVADHPWRDRNTRSTRRTILPVIGVGASRGGWGVGAAVWPRVLGCG